MKRALVLGWAAATLATVGAAAGATGGFASSIKSPGCRRALPQSPLGLPAPVIVTTSCGRFRIGQGDGVTYVSARTLPVPRGASYWADLTWYRFARGRLLIGRGHRQLWRSRGSYSATYPANIGVVVLGERALAFSYFRRLSQRSLLYLARYGARERLLARGETPIAFLRSGELVTWRDHGGALVLRAGDGRVQRLLVPRATDPQVDRQSRMLVFRVGDRLHVFDGDHVRELASLRQRGLKGFFVVEPLGKLVTVHDRSRLVVLDYEGRLVASTMLPLRSASADMVSSAIVSNASGTTVAFAATLGNTAYGSRGRETVYLLRAGESQARPLFNEQLDFKVCERAADLAWHGDWLLYSNSENRVAVIDSAFQEQTIELSDLIARLPGLRSGGSGFFEASWGAR